MWKKKFNCKPNFPKCIEGSNDNDVISEYFADFFSKNILSNISQDTLFKEEFDKRIKSYIGDLHLDSRIDVELVDSIVTKLTRGKAAGKDRIS